MPHNRAPFLKWPGGKRWLVPEIKRRIGEVRGTYYEPFLGGAAAFFALAPERAVLADVNCELIELYHVMRDSPELLRERLADHQSKHGKRHYYVIRAARPSNKVDRARSNALLESNLLQRDLARESPRRVQCADRYQD